MANILIFGSGVVGQATGKGLAKKGHSTRYIDIDPNIIKNLQSQGLDASTYKDVDWSDTNIVMVCVDTPTSDDGILLKPLSDALEKIGTGISNSGAYVDVILRSTIIPGTTENYALPTLERYTQSRVGEKFGLAYNPEFLRQKSSEHDFNNPWIIVYGALDSRTNQVLKELYNPFKVPLVECTPIECELIKYFHNIYNAVKISYFNEVYQISKHFRADSRIISETIAKSAEGIWNPGYGIRGGKAFSGGCLPKDTEAFYKLTQQLGLNAHLLGAAIKVNNSLLREFPP